MTPTHTPAESRDICERLETRAAADDDAGARPAATQARVGGPRGRALGEAPEAAAARMIAIIANSQGDAT